MRRRRRAGCFVLAFALLLAVAARADPDFATRPDVLPSLQLQTLVVGGLTRTAALYFPRVAGRALLPAFIILHGAGGTGAGMHRSFGAAPLADRAGVLLVYPDGLNRQWNDGRPPSLRYLPQLQDVDDVGFLTALIAKLAASGTVDPARIYVIGLSNGGGMALRLACERPDSAAGFSFIAAPASRSMLDRCRAGPRKPILVVHGTNDRVIPYAGGAIQMPSRDRLASAVELAEHWAVRNGCAVRPAEMDLADTDRSDGTRVHRAEYEGCPVDGRVTLFSIEGGGHQSPVKTAGLSGPAVAGALGNRSHDIDAAETAWQFFSTGRAGQVTEGR